MNSKAADASQLTTTEGKMEPTRINCSERPRQRTTSLMRACRHRTEFLFASSICREFTLSNRRRTPPTSTDQLARNVVTALTTDAPSLQRIRAALVPLGIVAGDNQSRGSSDVEPLVSAGVPAATLAIDLSENFDSHHTPDDTLDKVKPDLLNQSAAAYVVFTYLVAELSDSYRSPGLLIK